MKLAVFCLFAFSTPAAALTGNEFIEKCGGFPAISNELQAYCLSYVAGAMDGALAGAHITRLSVAVEAAENGGSVAIVGDRFQDLQICLSSEATVVQLTAIFLQYLEQKPNSWHHPAASTFLGAMRESFPCY